MAQVSLRSLVKNYEETPAVRGIDLDIQVPAEQVVAKYDQVYRLLRTKYGIPKQDRTELSPACASDVKSCLTAATPPRGAQWIWPDGNTIFVKLALVGNEPQVHLEYANPTRTKQTAPGPVL